MWCDAPRRKARRGASCHHHARIYMLRFTPLFCVLALTFPASAQEKTLPIGSGALQSLSALSEKVKLRGAGQLQQLVITGHFANGGVRDLTRQAKYRAVNTRIVRVDAGGL